VSRETEIVCGLGVPTLAPVTQVPVGARKPARDRGALVAPRGGGGEETRTSSPGALVPRGRSGAAQGAFRDV